MRQIANLILGMLISGAVFADQAPLIKYFNEGDQLNVNLSDTDINRISVDHDTIQNFSCEPGTCSVTNNANDQSGSIYINVAATAPSTMFITTKSGHNLSLNVTPVNSDGTTLILEPLSAGASAGDWEKNTPYVSLLIQVMSSFMNGQSPQNYSRFFCTQKDNDPCRLSQITMYKNLVLTPVEEVAGQELVGIEYSVQNTSNQPLDLYESAFYGSGVRAVALSEEHVTAKGTTNLYIVRSRT